MRVRRPVRVVPRELALVSDRLLCTPLFHYRFHFSIPRQRSFNTTRTIYGGGPFGTVSAKKNRSRPKTRRVGVVARYPTDKPFLFFEYTPPVYTVLQMESIVATDPYTSLPLQYCQINNDNKYRSFPIWLMRVAATQIGTS